MPARLRGALAEFLGRPKSETETAEGGSGTGRMAASAFATRIASAGLAYVGQVLLARWMGGFDYGIYVVAWTLVITFGVIFCFGLEQAIVRLVREYVALEDYAAIRGLLRASRAITFLVATATAATGALILWARPDIVEDVWRVPVLLAAVCLPIYTVAELQDGTARAWSWPDLAFMPTFIWRPLAILGTMAAFHLAGYPMTAVTGCLAAIVATWATTIVQMVLLMRRIDATIPPARPRYDIPAWLTLAGPIFLVDSFFALLNSVDIFVVGRFARPEEVAVYFATVKTLALVHFVYYAAKTAAAARFASLWQAGDRDGLERFAGKTVIWTFWASVAMSLVLLAFGKPLLWLFGREFTSGYGILFVLVLGVLARASVGPGEALLTMAGQQKASALVYGLTFFTSLLFNSLLTPIWGIWGAAVGTTLAMILESVLIHGMVRRRLGISVFILSRRTAPSV